MEPTNPNSSQSALWTLETLKKELDKTLESLIQRELDNNRLTNPESSALKDRVSMFKGQIGEDRPMGEYLDKIYDAIVRVNGSGN